MGLKNLGQVASLSVGASAPTNIKMLWYDTTVSYLKYYDPNAKIWRAVANTVVGASTLCAYANNLSLIKGNTNVSHPAGTVVSITVIDKDTNKFANVNVTRDTTENTIVTSSLEIANAEVNVLLIL